MWLYYFMRKDVNILPHKILQSHEIGGPNIQSLNHSFSAILVSKFRISKLEIKSKWRGEGVEHFWTQIVDSGISDIENV